MGPIRAALFLSIFLLGAPGAALGAELVRNGGFERGEDWRPDGWELHVWNRGARVAWAGRDGSVRADGAHSLKIECPEPNDVRWVQQVPVLPYRLYRVSGRISTRGAGSGEGSIGACLSLESSRARSRSLLGTQAWTEVELYVRTGSGTTSLPVACRLGFSGSTASGTAWFDDIRVVEIEPFYGYGIQGYPPTIPERRLRVLATGILVLAGGWIILALSGFWKKTLRGGTEEAQNPEREKGGFLSLERLSLTVFFPFYNEEANLERTVRRAAEVLAPLNADYEIVMVDDGSRDRTPEIGARLAAELPNVRLVRHEKNRGYGGALISGFMAARKEWVLFADGDGQFDLAEIPLLLERREGADAVLGYRLKRGDPFIRTVNSWSWKTLVRLLFGLRVRDLNCAFKLFRTKDVQRLGLRSQGAFLTVELLVKLKKAGIRFNEVGVRHLPRTAGAQTGASVKVILRAFGELIQLRRELR